jgi:hypothetical protein
VIRRRNRESIKKVRILSLLAGFEALTASTPINYQGEFCSRRLAHFSSLSYSARLFLLYNWAMDALLTDNLDRKQWRS